MDDSDIYGNQEEAMYAIIEEGGGEGNDDGSQFLNDSTEGMETERIGEEQAEPTDEGQTKPSDGEENPSDEVY
jgi:hypothetical protein